MAGQIIARGENTWLVRVYVGRVVSGRRKYLNKTIHGTKKDAQRWLTTTLRDQDLGLAVEPARQSLDQYLDKWFEMVAQPKLRPKTLAGYQDLLARHIRPVLGNLGLSKITPLDIQGLYSRMKGAGLSARTIEYTNMILKQAFKQAITWRLLMHNPCDGVELPRKEHREMQALSPEQARSFLAIARGERHGALLELALTTGLRPSEYCALKWSDIDLDERTVSIVRSIDFQPGGGWAFDENKTGRSRRVVKLHSTVVKALLQQRTQQDSEQVKAGENWRGFNLVFTNATGGPLDRHNLANRTFRRLLKVAGLPLIRLYDLRHTAATLALCAGVPVKVISEQLGHASAMLTLDTYSHVLPHMQDEAVTRVEALLAVADPKLRNGTL